MLLIALTLSQLLSLCYLVHALFLEFSLEKFITNWYIITDDYKKLHNGIVSAWSKDTSLFWFLKGLNGWPSLLFDGIFRNLDLKIGL